MSNEIKPSYLTKTSQHVVLDVDQGAVLFIWPFPSKVPFPFGDISALPQYLELCARVDDLLSEC